MNYLMHNHHDHCQHIIKHCTRCNIVFCTLCGYEWGRQYGWNYPTWWTVTSDDTSTVTTTSANVTGTVLGGAGCSHD